MTTLKGKKQTGLASVPQRQVSYIAIERSQPPEPLSPHGLKITYEDLYVWGFRFASLVIFSSLLFVAAIYYGVINP